MKYVLKKDVVFKAGTVVDMDCASTTHNGPMGLAVKAMGKDAVMTLVLDTDGVQFNRYFRKVGAA